MDYSYDGIGQLIQAAGKHGTTNRWHEQFGYKYDAAGNLNYRTNNALVQTFNTDSRHQLTSATLGHPHRRRHNLQRGDRGQSQQRDDNQYGRPLRRRHVREHELGIEQRGQ